VGCYSVPQTWFFFAAVFLHMFFFFKYLCRIYFFNIELVENLALNFPTGFFCPKLSSFFFRIIFVDLIF
jgi:hypothetical protein